MHRTVKSLIWVLGLFLFTSPAQATQSSLVFDTSTGTVLSGLSLVEGLNAAHGTLATFFSGAAAPTSPYNYQLWADTATNPVNYKLYDGASWVSIGTLNTTSHAWTAAGSSASYPSAGLAVSTGTGWGTSITDNSTNWNTAYGWGNHAAAGYALSSSLASVATSGTYADLTGKPTAVSTFTNDAGYLTGNQTVTLSGAVTGSGATAITTTLANSGVTAGTYGSSSAVPVITVNSKGLITATSTAAPSYSYPSAGLAVSTGTGWGTSVTNNSTNWNTAYGWGNHAAAGYLTGNQTVTLSGAVTGSGATAITTTLANSGVTAGTYGSSSAVPVITVNSKGLITATSTAAISGGGTGTVNSGTAGQAAYYAANGTAVSGTSLLTYGASAVDVSGSLKNSSAWGMKYIAGRKYRGDNSMIGGTRTAAIDRMIACPFMVEDASITAASVSVLVTTAASSSVLGFAIYDPSTSTNDPVNLITSTATVSAATTGEKTASFGSPPTLLPGLHWVVMNTTGGTPTLAAQPSWASTIGLITGASSVNGLYGDGSPVTAAYKTQTFGTWPSTFGTPTIDGTYGCPILALTAG